MLYKFPLKLSKETLIWHEFNQTFEYMMNLNYNTYIPNILIMKFNLKPHQVDIKQKFDKSPENGIKESQLGILLQN